MLTSDPSPHPKRKAPDDPNPLLTTAKRAKKETKLNASKRKVIGEEIPGGLVIVRAPTSPHPAQPTRQPSLPQPTATTPHAKPPSKKFRTDARTATNAKNRELVATSRSEPEVDEDVRRMESETHDLRSRTIGHDTIDPRIQFTPSKPHLRPTDQIQRLPESETPQIQRNKLFREGLVRRQPSSSPSHNSRRSSVSTRGKRISSSFESTGVITQPHTSVSDSSFYKHIDRDLPEPHRARQLLIWSTSRATTNNCEASSSRHKSPAQTNGKDPPPLSDRAQRAFRVVQDDMMRVLAEGKIDTSVYGGMENGHAEGSRTKEHEQNVKNRAREVTFTQHIERAKAEREAWINVDKFYNSYHTNSLLDLENRKQALVPPTSSKAKGKQRATSIEPPDDWHWLIPHSDDLAPSFHGSTGLDLAIRTLSSSPPSPLRLADVQFKLDSLFSFVSSTVQTTSVAQQALDRRFALLSLSLAARADSAPPPGRSPTSLSAYLPPGVARGRSEPGRDPQDLLRALSRVDMERPPRMIGDAARRAARELQRVQEGGGVGERRLTGLAPGVGTTPRKAPGTPRRKER